MEFSKRLDLFGAEVFAALNEKRRALEAEGRRVFDGSLTAQHDGVEGERGRRT